jgi:hypothetical protein
MMQAWADLAPTQSGQIARLETENADLRRKLAEAEAGRDRAITCAADYCEENEKLRAMVEAAVAIRGDNSIDALVKWNPLGYWYRGVFVGPDFRYLLKAVAEERRKP